MKQELVKNKEGETLKTKEGKELMEYKLEAGDEFIPVFNNVLEKEHEATVKGTTKTIKEYLLKVVARDKDGTKIADGKEIFIKLTPSQSKSLQNKQKLGVELTQTMFVAYTYNNQYGENVGVGEKRERKKPKSFEDFDKEE